jgi:hypothetical protein
MPVYLKDSFKMNVIQHPPIMQAEFMPLSALYAQFPKILLEIKHLSS